MGEIRSIPLSVLRMQFIENLNALISNSGLEPYMLEAILKSAYERAAVATTQQYKRELKIYEDSLKDNKGE